MSIIPPPFPWESVSLPSPAKEFSSPGEIITQVINYQFQIHATKTIFEFITQVSYYSLSNGVDVRSSHTLFRMFFFLKQLSFTTVIQCLQRLYKQLEDYQSIV